jgi:hypothetical protein
MPETEEALDTRLPQPRPTPSSFQEIADLALRQRATDAWRAASRLRRLMDAWSHWFYYLLRTGDNNPGTALRLKEEVAVCVRVLCKLNVNMETFNRCTIAELLSRFPIDPAPMLQPPWQQDQEYRRKTQALIQDETWGRLQGELLGFLQLLETAPSVALPAQTPPKNQTSDMRELSKVKPKGKPGRKPDTDLKEERRIVDAWQTGQYKTYDECAAALHKGKREIARSIDNHRHRTRSKKRRSPLAPE